VIMYIGKIENGDNYFIANPACHDQYSTGIVFDIQPSDVIAVLVWPQHWLVQIYHIEIFCKLPAMVFAPAPGFWPSNLFVHSPYIFAAPLGAHERQFCARMDDKIAIEQLKLFQFLFGFSGKFPNCAALGNIMRQRNYKLFIHPIVERLGNVAYLMRPLIGRASHKRQHIKCPAHIPLMRES